MSEASSQALRGEPTARVLVAGAGGYAGALAAKLVWEHPRLELAAATARSDAGRRLEELYPGYGVPLELSELALETLDELDAAIVSYPHGASAPIVAELRGRDLKVVDLSADFRLQDLRSYERWYGPHGAPELLEGAVYGLTELNREAIVGAELVANPGCYPTATVLALAPLAEEGAIADVVVDAKSGVSGAGRSAEEEMKVVKEEEDTRPYKVTGHRHQPEIAQELARLAPGSGVASNSRSTVTFVPHLLPFDQGELVSCYVRLERELSPTELESLYRDRYRGERFVELAESPPGVSGVRGTNLCRLHAAIADGGRVIAFAAIDNLWKGAASQAIQNLNLMLGLPEEEGIA